MGLAATGVALGSASTANAAPPNLPAGVPMDDKFWDDVKCLYPQQEGFINLHNGAIAPMPLAVQQAYEELYRYCNLAPSYNMWELLQPKREHARKQLAAHLNIGADTLAFCKNTTEAMNHIIFGIPLQRGDEVVLSTDDYILAINSWKQREQREGIVLKWIELNLPEDDEEVLVSKFMEAIGPKTKLVQLTHVINWTGQLLPAKQIIDGAHAKGCEVMLDGAHSFCQFPVDLAALGADYFTACCHKWLGAPYGTGLLYVAKDKQAQVWPLHGAYDPREAYMRKFEFTSNHGFPAFICIADALEIHNKIGTTNISNRLVELKQYWATRANNIDGVELMTTLDEKNSTALASFYIPGKEPEEIHTALLKENISTGVVRWSNKAGIRISPHIYTTTAELDKFLLHLEEIARA